MQVSAKVAPAFTLTDSFTHLGGQAGGQGEQHPIGLISLLSAQVEQPGQVHESKWLLCFHRFLLSAGSATRQAPTLRSQTGDAARRAQGSASRALCSSLESQRCPVFEHTQ